MTNVKIQIPNDAFARQQMLAEMHVRNGTSDMSEPEISARAYANEEAGSICFDVVACGR